jgi:hypothetical protein
MSPQTFEFATRLIREMDVEDVYSLLLFPPYIPKAETKRFEIVHEKLVAGTDLDVVSIRTSIMSGEPTLKVKLSSDWEIIKLIEKGKGVWMTTHPSEVYTQIYASFHAQGDVLIGGLGLGHVLHLIRKYNTKVKKIVCVEKEKDVIKLVKPYIDKNIQIVNSSIEDYLKSTRRKFDFIYLDTWAGDNEHTFYTTVLPLRALARKKLKVPIRENLIAWQEETMRGQVLMSLVNRKLMGDFKETLAKLKAIKDENTRKYFKVFLEFADTYKDLEQIDCDTYTERATKFVYEYGA